MFFEIPQAALLIVDDEPLITRLICKYLNGWGYNLKTAHDGDEAWELLVSRPADFEAVLLDRSMPRMNGLDVLMRIKSHLFPQTLPVIMQTAASSREDVIEGLQAGAYYYLTKPFDEKMLCAIVGTAVEDRRRYLALQRQIEVGARRPGLIKFGFFEFLILEEAKSLATFLANACPDLSRVVTGLSELLVNAVEHGNLGITYQEKSELNHGNTWRKEIARRLALPENQAKLVTVEFHNRSDVVWIRIQEHGPGFDWSQYLEIDEERAFHTHGRGIALARLYSFDTLEYKGSGNEVEVTVCSRPSQTE